MSTTAPDGPDGAGVTPSAMAGRQPRRRMLKAALVGGAALVAGPALAARPAEAYPECPLYPGEYCLPDPGYYEYDVGAITLGGLLVTYASAPLNARGSLTWSMSRSRTQTTRSITEYGEQLTASFNLFSFDISNQSYKFSVTNGEDHVQGKSTRFTDAITIASTEAQSIQTAPAAAGAYNAWENTAFLIMARPVQVISIRIDYYYTWDPFPPYTRYTEQADPSTKYYRFVDGGIIFPRSARELRDDPATRDFIGASTADSILAEYPLRPGQTSATQLGLGGPRFGPPTGLAPGSTPFTFTRSMTGTTTHAEERTRTVQTNIRSGFSLSAFGITFLGFNTNQQYRWVHTAAQEVANTQVMTTTGVLSSDLNHLNYVIEDRVWNTMLITDEGPLSGAFDAVTGVVTAVDGTPVSGAVVSMPVGGVTHETFTDKRGRYAFRLGGDVKPGAYKVTCAGVTHTVSVAPRSTAKVDYRRVSTVRARERSAD